MSWRGTRFWPGCGGRAKKGVGADCVSFVEKVLVECKAIAPIAWPQYVIANGGLQMFDLLVDTLAAIPQMQIIWRWHHADFPELLAGDVFLVSGGEHQHHLAIYAGAESVWHVTRELRGVGTGSAHDPLLRANCKAIYRCYESA